MSGSVLSSFAAKTDSPRQVGKEGGGPMAWVGKWVLALSLTASFGLSKDNRLINQRRLAVDRTDVFSDAAGQVRHLPADQSPVPAVRLIEVDRLKPGIASAEAATDALI